MIKPVDLRMSLKKKSSLPAPPLAFLQVSSELHKQTGESVFLSWGILWLDRKSLLKMDEPHSNIKTHCDSVLRCMASLARDGHLKSLMGYSPWSCKVRYNWVTKSPQLGDWVLQPKLGTRGPEPCTWASIDGWGPGALQEQVGTCGRLKAKEAVVFRPCFSNPVTLVSTLDVSLTQITPVVWSSPSPEIFAPSRPQMLSCRAAVSHLGTILELINIVHVEKVSCFAQ